MDPKFWGKNWDKKIGLKKLRIKKIWCQKNFEVKELSQKKIGVKKIWGPQKFWGL